MEFFSCSCLQFFYFLFKGRVIKLELESSNKIFSCCDDKLGEECIELLDKCECWKLRVLLEKCDVDFSRVSILYCTHDIPCPS